MVSLLFYTTFFFLFHESWCHWLHCWLRCIRLAKAGGGGEEVQILGGTGFELVGNRSLPSERTFAPKRMLRWPEFIVVGTFVLLARE